MELQVSNSICIQVQKASNGKIKGDTGNLLRKLCEWKGVEILEAKACPEHIYMLVQIPPKISVLSFMGYLKGKSSFMIFDKLPIRNANMETESFGVEDIMWIQ